MSSTYTYHPRWSANRHAWLRHLAGHPGAQRSGRGIVGCACMRLGWTEWVCGADGRPDLTGAEVLTDEGRRVLAEWDANRREQ